MKSMMEWALDLAALGFDIGPLLPRDKAPITPNGLYDFVDYDNKEQIEQWWTRHPTANVGVRVPAGHVVIDIDPRNGGNDTWQSIKPERTATFAVATGGGGWHLYYELPYEFPMKGQLGPGVDIKKNNGYVVGPGSIHPNGKPYFVAKQSIFPPARLPDSLIPLMKRYPDVPTTKATSGNSEGLVKAVMNAQPGERNRVLYWAACAARDNGTDLDHELTLAAQHIGLEEREISQVLRNARGCNSGGVR